MTLEIVRARGRTFKLCLRRVITQFQVMTSEASAGAQAPDPKRFTLSMPLNNNVLILQSEELMYADQVALELGVASNAEANVRYEFKLP